MSISTDQYSESAASWLARIREGNNAAHSLLEKPAMARLLPPLDGGTRILCLGCGSAEEVAMLVAHGAAQRNITGLDISGGLIDAARVSFPEATFVVASMDELAQFKPHSFDFIYSSLLMHYSDVWLPVLHQVRRLLTVGGKFLFSTHHPVKWGAEVVRGEALDTFAMGYERPKVGMPAVHGDYLGSRTVQDNWFGQTMPVTFYHRPLKAILAELLASGLTLEVFDEPSPIPEAKTVNPSFHAIHSKVPLFMIFRLVK